MTGELDRISATRAVVCLSADPVSITAKVTRATLHPRLYRLSFETRGKKEAATSSGS